MTVDSERIRRAAAALGGLAALVALPVGAAIPLVSGEQPTVTARPTCVLEPTGGHETTCAEAPPVGGGELPQTTSSEPPADDSTVPHVPENLGDLG